MDIITCFLFQFYGLKSFTFATLFMIGLVFACDLNNQLLSNVLVCCVMPGNAIFVHEFFFANARHRYVDRLYLKKRDGQSNCLF